MHRSLCRTSAPFWAALVVAVLAPFVLRGEDRTVPNEPRTTRLTLYPAQPPAIALKYRLLPRYLDLVRGNAAVQYLKALSEGGDKKIREHAEKIGELLEQERKDFQVEEARKILYEIGSSPFEFLRLASVREECDWDLPIHEQQFYSILLPELTTLRGFARYLALRARVQIAEGKIDEAIETLRVGYALARNGAKGPTLVNSLVAVSIASMMNKVLLELIELPAAPNFYWSVAALPEPFIDARRAMDLEQDGMYLMFPQLKDVATTTLTDDQWNLRLVEFGRALNGLSNQVVQLQDWKGKLELGVQITATAVVNYSRAKSDLLQLGWPEAQLDRMTSAQLILLHIGQTYEVLRDDMFKWFHIPYWQADEAMRRADENLKATGRQREILPLASLLLPAINSARFAIVRLDRELAAIRTVEALRFYAATHDRKLPESLADIKDVPVPMDPVTGKDFDYRLEGSTATLDGKAPAGRTPENHAIRFIVTVAKPNEAGDAARLTSSKPADRPKTEPGAAAQQVVSDVSKGLIEMTTTNPIWEVVEAPRRARSINNLKQIGLAMHNYHDVYKHFPPAASVDKNGKPLLSWRVHVLPYLDQGRLYRQFKLDEPWDSEHNKKLIEQMPNVYRVPALPALPKYTTTYFVPVGEETIFHDNKVTRFKDIKDGTAKTILLLEADIDQAVPWTKPGDWRFDRKDLVHGLGELRRGKFLVTWADDHVTLVDLKAEKDRLPAFFTYFGDEDLSDWQAR